MTSENAVKKGILRTSIMILHVLKYLLWLLVKDYCYSFISCVLIAGWSAPAASRVTCHQAEARGRKYLAAEQQRWRSWSDFRAAESMKTEESGCYRHGRSCQTRDFVGHFLVVSGEFITTQTELCVCLFVFVPVLFMLATAGPDSYMLTNMSAVTAINCVNVIVSVWWTNREPIVNVREVVRFTVRLTVS